MKKLILILLLASCQPQQKQIVKGYIVKKQIVKNVKGDPIYVTTISVNGSLVNYYGINYYMMEEGDTIEINNK